jgi:hypothetical protein
VQLGNEENLNQLLLFSHNDPNDEANSSDDDGVIKKDDWPIDNGMSLRPVAQIGWGRRPITTYVLLQLFHGGVGIVSGWGHRATIADCPMSANQDTTRIMVPRSQVALGNGPADGGISSTSRIFILR